MNVFVAGRMDPFAGGSWFFSFFEVEWDNTLYMIYLSLDISGLDVCNSS